MKHSSSQYGGDTQKFAPRWLSATFAAALLLETVSTHVAAAPPVAVDDVYSPRPTATKTLVMAIPGGADGDVIAFNPNDNLIYRCSGNGTQTFDKIDPVAMSITPIVLSGPANGEIFGMVWYTPISKFLTSDISSSINTLTTDGVRADVAGSSLPDDLRGLALVGNRVFGTSPFQSGIWEIDPSTGKMIPSPQSPFPMGDPIFGGFHIVIDGVNSNGATSVTTDPITKSVYAMVKKPAVTGRVLAIINPITGIATSIGDTGDKFSTLTFSSTGILYGATGKGATVAKTLFSFTRAAVIATEDSPAQVFTGLLANDTDPDADTIDTVPAAAAPTALGATVTILAGGSFRYDPSTAPALQALAQDEIATDTFNYTLKDQNGETATGKVTVQVAGVNDAPVVDLDGPGGTVDFTGLPVLLFAPATTKVADADATVSDVDAPDKIYSLTATLGGALDAGMETLSATPSGGADTIMFAGNVLTVTASGGSAPPADYQAVLRSITYQNTSPTPTAGDRTVAVQVSDGLALSAVATRTIVTFVRPANPVVTVAVAKAGPIVKGAPTGSPAPGAGMNGLAADATISAFFTPAISDFRDLAARATLIAAKKKLGAIYVEDLTGAGVLAAFEGKQADGLPAGVVFSKFRDPLLGPDGDVTFPATVKGGDLKGTNDEGVWTEVFGALAPVLRESAQVPGLPAGVTLKSVVSLSPRPGELLALVKLNKAAGLVTAKDDTALILLTGPAAATKLLRTGDTTNGPIALAIAAFLPAQFSKGQGGTHADAGVVVRVKTDTKGDQIVLISDAGVKQVLINSVDQDPSLGAQAAKIFIPATAGIGTASRVSAKLPAAKKALDSIIFTATNQPFNHIISAGDMIPGGGADFVSFNDPVVNDAPSAVFLAKFDTAKAPGNTALYSWNAAFVESEVARGGAPATDPAGAQLMDTVWKNFTNYALPDGPGAGVVFIAEATGKAVTGKNKIGLWADDSAQKVRLLLRADADVLVAPGVTKKLSSFRLLDALPGSFGSRRSYNATGSVVVLATFADKTQALLRIDIP